MSGVVSTEYYLVETTTNVDLKLRAVMEEYSNGDREIVDILDVIDILDFNDEVVESRTVVLQKLGGHYNG